MSIIASKELISAVENYEQYIAKHGISEKPLDYYVEAVKTAFLAEKDIQYGLIISERCKGLIHDLIRIGTEGGDFKFLEEWSQKNKQEVKLINQFYEICKLESPYKFESYLYYMERDRQYDKRFYMPRRKTLHIVAQDMQDLEDDVLDTYGLSMPSRVGKALAYDTPVLTENGWKKHGDLTIRDKVIGLDGKFKKIIAIHNPCTMEYKVITSDGEEIICHGNHEWYVMDRRTGEYSNIETKEMFGKEHERGGHARFIFPIRNAIQGKHKELSVDPYTLGAWLGDGRNTNPDICGAESDYAIIKHIIDNGYEISWDTKHKTTGVRYYGFRKLRSDLQKYGMCHSRKRVEKYIPDEYQTASIEQRLELLAGLLDTDGYLSKKEKRYQFTTNEELLRDGIITLINGFGWRTSVTRRESGMSSSGIYANKPYWVVSFNPTMYIPCQLERKQLFEFSKQRRTTIEKIEKIDNCNTQGNCITVDGGIYRVGKRLVPTHNSTICIFFLSWVGLRKPMSHNAMGGHSGQLVKRFFRGLDNVIDTPEYRYNELFSYANPTMKKVVERKSSDPAELTINLGKADEFSTFTCRSADATWTGAIDVSEDGYLYVDDLVRDREHSLSASRMENTYQEYQNKMLDRMNDGAKKILVGTLWSVLDPLIREEHENIGNPRARFRKIPALNENDESNFQYEYKGFSSKWFIDMRQRLEKAEWMAKFQQSPFVREGLTFPTEQLRRFDGNVPKDKCRTWAALDPAFGRGDSLSMPVCKDFGDTNKFIVDWVHDKRTIAFTIPLVADKIQEHMITELKIEKNRGGDLFAEKLQEELDTRGIRHCHITLENAPVKMSKEDKISGYSDFIKRYFLFLTLKKWTDDDDYEYHASDQYRKAIDEMTMFSAEGKNINDDAADSITQLAMMFENRTSNRAKIIASPI